MMANKNKKTDFGATAEFRARRKKKKGMAGWQKFLIGIALMICVLILTAVGVFTYFKYIHRPTSDVVTPPISTPVVNGDSTSSESTDNRVRNDRYNFLVIGCDRREWLSDVVMIATYDVAEKSVSIMQIPRDTYVTVSNTLDFNEDGSISAANFDGKNDYGTKINAVLGQGGTFAGKELKRLTGLAKGASASEIDKLCKESFLNIDRKALENYMNASGSAKSQIEYDIRLEFGIQYLSALLTYSFGTPFDYYAQVNLDGFVSIVDAIGGVDVYVQHDMDYDDPYQDLHIHIKKGQQHLDGKKAEGFIRYRYGYAAADIARIDAQKIFMTAFIKKVLSLEGIMNLNDLVTEIGNHLNTNIPFADALYFATHALDVDLSKVVMLTMPGTPQYVDNISYYLIDKTTMIEQVNTYLNKFTKPLGEEHFLTTQIANKNTSSAPLTAEQITDSQPDLGFLSGGSSKPSTQATSQTPATQPSASEIPEKDKDAPSEIPETVIVSPDPLTPSAEQPDATEQESENDADAKRPPEEISVTEDTDITDITDIPTLPNSSEQESSPEPEQSETTAPETVVLPDGEATTDAV